MLKVTHEKIETVTESFNLIDLDTYFHGYQLYIRVPSSTTKSAAEHLERRAQHRFQKLIEKDIAFM